VEGRILWRAVYLSHWHMYSIFCVDRRKTAVCQYCAVEKRYKCYPYSGVSRKATPGTCGRVGYCATAPRASDKQTYVPQSTVATGTKCTIFDNNYRGLSRSVAFLQETGIGRDGRNDQGWLPWILIRQTFGQRGGVAQPTAGASSAPIS
jgi:hypothetical protein